ncbi:FERM domain-containing protein 5-like [Ictalurus furcatus]|uniref:FERM domain-containing protein 5-like n=1 Tax=Ictalurus furcatus TaxID=66913 RepID=UPI002350266D|nr:FERM domain-containing protein 5-like [Ictalurus furcatus]
MLCEPLFGKCLEPSLPHLTHLWHYACSQGLQAPVTGLALIYIHWQPANLLIFSFCGIMVKCLIRISTRVNVHLRMINHCYRDVKVHVLSLGPRLLGKALGVLPLYPAITSQQEAVQAFPLPATPQPCVLSSTSSGLESLRDNAPSTLMRSISHSDSFIPHSHSQVNECSNIAEVITKDIFSPLDSVLPTPVTELSLEPAALTTGHANGTPCSTEEEMEAEQSTVAVREPGEPGTTARSAVVVSVITEVEELNKFVLSVLCLLHITIRLLFVLLLLLIIFTESDLDVAFLHDIRQTPKFEQFHYEYFCPLRRWFACKLHWVGGLFIRN